MQCPHCQRRSLWFWRFREFESAGYRVQCTHCQKLSVKHVSRLMDTIMSALAITVGATIWLAGLFVAPMPWSFLIGSCLALLVGSLLRGVPLIFASSIAVLDPTLSQDDD